jgi:hypothetical protein
MKIIENQKIETRQQGQRYSKPADPKILIRHNDKYPTEPAIESKRNKSTEDKEVGLSFNDHNMLKSMVTTMSLPIKLS